MRTKPYRYVDQTPIIKNSMRIFRREKRQSDDAATSFLVWLCQIPENHWVANDARVFALWESLASRLDSRQVRTIQEKDLIIVQASGVDACAIELTRPANLILLFPEMMSHTSLKSGRSTTILAHELGHILHRHGQRAISNEEAQFEADAFAAAIGFKQELCMLLSREAGMEAKKRLARLKAA